MHCDDVAMLDAEVVASDSIYACAAIVQIVIGHDNQDSVLSLLALDQYGIAAEELERLHGVVGEGNDGVVIAYGIGNTFVVMSANESGFLWENQGPT
jgi:hypothetical protein